MISRIMLRRRYVNDNREYLDLDYMCVIYGIIMQILFLFVK